MAPEGLSTSPWAIQLEKARKRPHRSATSDGVMHTKTVSNCWSQLAGGRRFKMCCGALIFANTLAIGIEVNSSMAGALEKPPQQELPIFQAINRFFASAFVIELAIRILADRLRFFFGSDQAWNVFDAVMVLSSIAEEFVGGALGVGTSIRILRVFRLVRTLRIIRIVKVFRNLRMMVCCIFNSLMALFWALVLLALVMYLFSIACVQGAASQLRENAANSPQDSVSGVAANEQELLEQMQQHYPSIPQTILTLLMSVSGGIDWSEAVRPLFEVSRIYVVFFVIYIVFVLYGVLNVLAAVFVEHALQVRDKDLLIQAEKDKTRAFMSDMVDLFKEADTDQTGILTRDEMNKYLKDPRVTTYMATHQLDVSDVSLMFKLLDTDNTGHVDMEEFVLGCLRLKGHARCLDITRMYECLDTMHRNLADLLDSFSKQNGCLQVMAPCDSKAESSKPPSYHLEAGVHPRC